MLRSDTSDMTRPVNNEELQKVEGAVPTQRSAPSSNKRKHSPGELHLLARYTTITYTSRHGSPVTYVSGQQFPQCA